MESKSVNFKKEKIVTDRLRAERFLPDCKCHALINVHKFTCSINQLFTDSYNVTKSKAKLIL